MESTACGDNCPFVKSGLCDSDKTCPNYVESWWVETGSGSQKKICDCSPKRMMLQQQYLESRMEAVQQALEQSRNQYNMLMKQLAMLIGATQNYLNQPVNRNSNEPYKPLPYDKSSN